MTFTDLLFTAILAACVPALVRHYLPSPFFLRRFRNWVILGGISWVLYCLVSDQLLYFIYNTRADALAHELIALNLAEQLKAGNWEAFRGFLSPGNNFYIAYQALIYYSTGASVLTINVINGWLAFWGGLILARQFSNRAAVRKQSWLFLLIIFFPSVIFWTSFNLKEGMMYWSICNLFTRVRSRAGAVEVFSSPAAIAALALGGMLRPHIMVAWVVAVASVSLLERGRRGYALLVLIALPLLAANFRAQTGVELASEKGFDYAYSRAEHLTQYTGAPTVELEERRPIFFVSGFLATFFRPFPWEMRSPRVLVNSVETWVMTYLIFSIWFRMRPSERRACLRLPEIRAAIVAVLLFSVFFSFIVNEGLMVRQRVQVVPALLALAVLPRWQRQTLRENVRREKMRRMVSAPAYSDRHSV